MQNASNFLPSLTRLKNPQKIKKFLDEKFQMWIQK